VLLTYLFIPKVSSMSSQLFAFFVESVRSEEGSSADGCERSKLMDSTCCIVAVIADSDVALRYVDRLPVETFVTDRARFTASRAGHRSRVVLP
jgi:hypothetical protein